MQSFQVTTALPAGQKNFVFVDEHNRHKRLKVMRACEGCRRRKIKCDSATSNVWPCSACTRLKLHCVPPATGSDGDLLDGALYEDSETAVDYAASTTSERANSLSYDDYPRLAPTRSLSAYQAVTAPLSTAGNFSKSSFTHVENYDHSHHQTFYTDPTATTTFRSNSQIEAPIHSAQSRRASSPTQVDESTADELSEQLGDLRIGENGIAPYLRQQQTFDTESEVPIQEAEVKLPPMPGTGSQIRIPPALMPSDEDAVHLFQLFFRDVHPYVPVINRNYFYYQWHSNRSALSPLVLEAVFACAGRMSDDPAGGSQWLALANKHEDSFLDKPRLSTLQALLLLLKAREGSPKRGYYYRSWMTCKTIVSMAKDLDLHEHYDNHRNGEHCGSEPVECLTKTRIWQTILICEMMVGGPQGRSDMGVDPNTVDISPNPPGSDIDDFEKTLSRHFAYFVRNARNIRLITDSSQRLKKRKDWGLDPEFVAHNAAFRKWPSELPPDLQLSLPADGSPPNLASHFVGNMHCHYQLGIVMLHRPQLVASKSFATDSAWRLQMVTCYNSAKLLCRLQEAILGKFGLVGLLCMQRGINFTIYAILTCTMIHLIAVTSPDPDFNEDAREYFTRHMRILEECITSWPMPETEAQINALRSAFSVDINKPFQLRASFPYGTPSEYRASISPPVETQSRLPSVVTANQYAPPPQRHLSTASYMMTPPISAHESKPDSPHFLPEYMPEQPTYSQMPSGAYQQPDALLSQPQWNPTPIIDQFNTAFAIPPAALAPPPHVNSYPQPHMSSPHISSPHFSAQAYAPQPYAVSYTSSPSYPQQQYMPTASDVAPTSAPQYLGQPTVPVQSQYPQMQQQQTYTPPGPVYVSAKAWQQSVASVVDPEGLKRRWNDESDHFAEQLSKRMR